jgi:hypothetical protein
MDEDHFDILKKVNKSIMLNYITHESFHEQCINYEDFKEQRLKK